MDDWLPVWAVVLLVAIVSGIELMVLLFWPSVYERRPDEPIVLDLHDDSTRSKKD